jgi:hypothetical protein
LAALRYLPFNFPFRRVPVAQLNVTNGVITNVNDETAELRGPGQTDQHDDRLPQGQVRPAVRAALAPLAPRYLMFCARALVGSEGKKPPVVKINDRNYLPSQN